MLTVRWRHQQARRDRPLAMLVQILLNVHRAEHHMPFELATIMEWLGHRDAVKPEAETLTPEQMQERLSLLATLYNGSSPGQHAD